MSVYWKILFVVTNMLDNMIHGGIDLQAVGLDLVGWLNESVTAVISQLERVRQGAAVAALFEHRVEGPVVGAA